MRSEPVLAAAAAKRHSNWLQTVFAAKHAAAMGRFVRGMGNAATNDAVTVMNTLNAQGVFKKRVSIAQQWQPDLPLLHHFGSLPDINGKFNTVARRQVRCSPQLSAFITCNTAYRHPPTGPSPEVALHCLLRHCFVGSAFMFKDACSPYQLLCSSHMLLDMAFVRAVIAASAWLGPDAMLVGYISTWPPPESETGL